MLPSFSKRAANCYLAVGFESPRAGLFFRGDPSLRLKSGCAQDDFALLGLQAEKLLWFLRWPEQDFTHE